MGCKGRRRNDGVKRKKDVDNSVVIAVGRGE